MVQDEKKRKQKTRRECTQKSFPLHSLQAIVCIEMHVKTGRRTGACLRVCMQGERENERGGESKVQSKHSTAGRASLG